MNDYNPNDQIERIRNYWNYGLPVTDRQLKAFGNGTTIMVLAGMIYCCTLLALKMFGLMHPASF